MWQESGSSIHDFDKLALLVRTQVAWSLADEGSKTWLDLERDFLEADYQVIRGRQMELMEKEDGMMTRQTVVELRDKLALESYDVVAEQRLVARQTSSNADRSGFAACCRAPGLMRRAWSYRTSSRSPGPVQNGPSDSFDW